MEPKVKTSFIPQKTLLKKEQNHKRPISLVLLLSSVVFFVILVMAGGVYLYKAAILKQVENDNTNLVSSQDSFDPTTITNLQRLDRRIVLAQELLSKHTASSRVLKTLEELTLQNVRFSKFDYNFNNKGATTINLRGEAKSYSSVALQSDIFGNSKYIKNPIFSDLDLNGKGNVTFNFSASIDPSLILYNENL